LDYARFTWIIAGFVERINNSLNYSHFNHNFSASFSLKTISSSEDILPSLTIQGFHPRNSHNSSQIPLAIASLAVTTILIIIS
jgi:hypothetical protein